MAHNADGTEIVTVEQARQYFRDNACPDLIEDIKRAMNVDEASIDADGNVWVGNPQPHWVRWEDLVKLVERVERGV